MFEESQSDGLIPCKPCKIPILRAQFYSNDLSNLIVELSNVKNTLRMPYPTLAEILNRIQFIYHKLPQKSNN